jgi:hypothetical protein
VRKFVALLAALASGVVVAVACNSAIDQPPRLDDGGVPPTGTGTGGDTGVLDDGGLPPDTIDFDATDLDTATLGDGADDTNIDDTYDPEVEYLEPPDCGVADGEYDGASISDGGIPTGTRFCELYRDFIHVGGVAKCQSYHCHGGESGFKNLSMGYDLDGCYAAITSHVAKYFPPPRTLVVPGLGALSRSALMDYIKIPPPSPAPPDAGFMPLTFDWLGNRKLTPEEILRFKIWLARGAPKD